MMHDDTTTDVVEKRPEETIHLMMYRFVTVGLDNAATDVAETEVVVSLDLDKSAIEVSRVTLQLMLQRPKAFADVS